MIGLIKKDLLMIKSNMKIIIVMLLVFFIMAAEKNFDISFVPPFITVMLFMSTFSYDEFNKWDGYAVTLPSGRKSVVRAKYITSIILLIASIVITILLNTLVGIIDNNLDFNKFVTTLVGCAFGVVLVESIMYPFIFKYGIEKGRIGLFVLAFAICGLAGLLSNMVDIKIPEQLLTFFNNFWFIVVPIVILIVLLISYKISEKIYLKKEF